MRFLLDTNICIYLIKKKPTSVIERLQSEKIDDIGISSITLSELLYGVEKSKARDRNMKALIKFLAPLHISPYGDRASQEYGGIRAALEKQGTPIGPLDMLIAAHARSANFTLVTNNEGEFRRVPGLAIENWVGPAT